MKRRWVSVTTAALLLLIIVLGVRVLADTDDDDFAMTEQQYRVDVETYQGPIRVVQADKVAKAGPLVVGIHGTPGSWTAWKALMTQADVQSTYQVFALDRPGWGDSRTEQNRVFPEFKTQAEILSPVLKALSEEQSLTLVAHSWGGPVALQLAADYPEMINGLVLIASPADPAKSEPRWYHRLAELSPVQWLIGESMTRSNEEMLILHHELERLAPQLASIQQPVAIIQGGRDWLVHQQNARYLEGRLTNAPTRLDLDPKGNHFIPFRHPERVANALDWVQQNRR